MPSSDQAGLLRAAGRAWGFVGLARAAPYWAARRRTFFPAALRAKVGLELADVLAGQRGHAYTSALRAVLDRGAGALSECQRGARALPPAIFPAISYVSFASDYARAIMRAGAARDDQRMRLGQFARRVKLVQATVRGVV
jgi:phytoene/squalene synthetase